MLGKVGAVSKTKYPSTNYTFDDSLSTTDGICT